MKPSPLPRAQVSTRELVDEGRGAESLGSTGRRPALRPRAVIALGVRGDDGHPRFELPVRDPATAGDRSIGFPLGTEANAFPHPHPGGFTDTMLLQALPPP